MTIHNIELSTTEPFNYTKLIKIRQDDTESQTFDVEVTENGKVLDLSNYNVLMVSRPNGFLVKEPITNPSNLTVGKFSHTISSSFWQKLGQNDAWFSFEQNGVVKDSTTNFSYVVIEGDCRNIPQGNYLWDLEELKRKLEEMGLDLSNNYNDFKERLDVLLEMFKTMNTYSKEEIDRMLIKLIAGEKISATFTMDYKNKVAGSLVENPSLVKLVTSQDMPIPSDARWQETATSVYRQLDNLDNQTANASTAEALNSRKIMASFNILEDFKRKFPSLSVNVDLLKKYIVSMKPSSYAKGSNSAGYHCQLNAFGWTDWQGGEQNANKTNELKKLETTIAKVPNYLQNDGNLHVLISAKASDGKTPSTLSVDYISLDYTVELSLRDIFATKEELEAVNASIRKYVADELAKKQDKITDSGFIVATLSGGAIQDANNPLRYRKRDKLAVVKGYVTLPNNVGAVIWTPPTGFAPSSQEIIRVTLEDTNADRKAFVRFSGGRLMVAYNNWSSSAFYLEAIYYVD